MKKNNKFFYKNFLKKSNSKNYSKNIINIGKKILNKTFKKLN